MKEIKCELCGYLIDSRGLRAHQKGAACASIAEPRRLRAAGYERCGNYVRPLKRAGLNIQYAPTSYNPGGPRRRVKLHYSPFAPAWAVRAYEILRAAGTPVNRCVELISRGENDPELQATLALEVIRQ